MKQEAVQSVANKLIKRIAAYCLVSLLCIAVVQGYLAWRHATDEFELGMRAIGQTQLQLLSIGVWEAEPHALEEQLEQISQQPYIGYARLTADVGAVFEAGDPELRKRTDVRTFNIAQPDDRSVSIGTLEIAPDPGVLYGEILRSLGFSMAAYIALCGVIIVLLKRELERPLRHVMDYMTSLPQPRTSEAAAVDRGEGHRRDELDIVLEGFQTLQSQIEQQMRTLDSEVESRTTALQAAMESIQQLSIMDPLTACYNRRLFNERIVQEAERADRYQRPLTLVFADIDFFKRVNDRYGHSVGDQALCRVAAIMRGETRESVDWVVRYGGEEFVMVLPETDQDSAVRTAERVRQAIASEPLLLRGKQIALTCSFGVAQYQPDEPTAAWLERVDHCLYRAKQSGRNRVCAWENLDVQI